MKGKKSIHNQINFNRAGYLINDSLSTLSADVTFKLADGSKKTIPINKQSMFDRNNKKIKATEFIKNLNSIKNDYKAESYDINIIK